MSLSGTKCVSEIVNDAGCVVYGRSISAQRRSASSAARWLPNAREPHRVVKELQWSWRVEGGSRSCFTSKRPRSLGRDGIHRVKTAAHRSVAAIAKPCRPPVFTHTLDSRLRGETPTRHRGYANFHCPALSASASLRGIVIVSIPYGEVFVKGAYHGLAAPRSEACAGTRGQESGIRSQRRK